MKVGIVGLGKMGGAMAARFSDRGFSVIGWDANPAQLACLNATAQQAASSAAEVAREADCVISIVSDGPGVRDLYLGHAGFLSRPVEGKIFIEMSTVGPAIARELEPLVMSRGASWIEAPVMGSVPKARDGTLLALAGGRAMAVGHASPVLAAITRQVLHIGPAGSGYTMKLCSNLLMGTYLQAISEALALGTSAGISLDVILDILKDSPVASPWLASKNPILRGGDGDMTLDIVSLRKDIMAAVGAGADIGVPMPAGAGVLSALSAAVAHGEGHKDLAEHATFFREHMVQKLRMPAAK